MSRFDKIFYTLLAIFITYTTIGFKLIPYIAQEQLVKNLDKTLTVKSHVKNVEFNPYTFNAKIHGLKLGEEKNPLVSLDTFEVDVGFWKSIFKLHVNIEKVRLSSLFVDVVQDKEDIINLTKLVKPTSKEEPKKEESSSTDIKFLVSQIILENSSINFTKQKENHNNFTLKLHDINYNAFDVGTYKDSLAASTLSLMINDTAKIKVKGGINLAPFKTYGTTTISSLNLEQLIKYKEEILNFKLDKKASFDMSLNYEVDTSKDLDVRLNTDKLLLSNINLSQNKKDVLKLDSLDVSRFDFDLLKENIAINGVNLNKPYINAIKSKDSINLATLVKQDTNKKETKEEVNEKKPNNWNINLNDLNINNSNLIFQDKVANTLIKNDNFNINTSNINILSSKIAVNDVKVSNPKLSVNDNKNKTSINAKDLNISLNKLALVDNKIDINKITINKDKISFYDKKSTLNVNTYKTKVSVNNISLKDGITNISSISSKVANIKLNNKKDKLKIDIKNTNTTVEAINLNKDLVTVKSVKVAKPSINLNNGKNNNQIKAKNITLSLNNIKKDSKAVKIKSLKLYEPSLNIYNTKEKTRITASNIDLRVKDISSFNNGLLKIASTNLIKPKIQVVLPKKPASKKDAKNKKVVNKKRSKEEPKLDVGPVNIKDATLVFQDKNLAIPFKTTVSKLNGKISEFVTTQGSKTRLEVNGIVDRYGTTKITGIVNPNNIKILTDINMIFKNISVKNFTPYSGKFVGRAIDDGKLDLDLKYNIQKSDLDAQNSIVITKLELGNKVESKDAVSLPLELAIALLEDTNGVIDLNIPVSGNLDDPKLSVAPIVWKAFTNLIMKAITAPFSLLGAMFGFDENEIKSVSFDYGQSKVTPIQKETLDKISKILVKRPNLALKLVPSYEETKDLKALKQIKFDTFVKSKLPNDLIKGYEDKYLKVLETKYKTYDKKLEAKKKYIKDKKLNKTEYTKFLENTLLSKEKVTKKDLEAMAKARVENMKEYLVKEKKIKTSQVHLEKEVKVKIQSSKKSIIDLELDKSK